MNRVAAVLLATLVALLAAAPAPAATPREFFGVMADGPLLGPGVDLRRETRLMGAAGARTARVAFYWRSLQPRADAPVDFRSTDRIVGEAARAGVRVFPVLVRAPSWATGGDEREGAVPNDPETFARFADAAVRRYGSGGAFWAEHPEVRARPVRHWQVWNEPDITRYWEGRPWAPTYVRLLRAASPAIHAADPQARVVAAGLTNRSWEDLDEVYRAGGGPSFDAAAIHPFSRRVSNVLRITALARQTMRRHGDAAKPLMLTEVSWSSGRGRSTFNYGWETTERGQATKLRQAFQALAAARERLGLGQVFWYTWLSPRLGRRESFSYSGLRRMTSRGPRAKPAYRQFRRTVRRLTSG
jgi:hypothetical protein